MLSDINVHPRSALPALLSISALHQKVADLLKGIAVRKSWTKCEMLRNRQHPGKTSIHDGISWNGRLPTTRNGFKQARWRRLWRVRIQEYMISAIQNIMVLLSHGKERGMAKGCSLPAIKKSSFSFYLSFLNIRNVVDRFFKDTLFSARRYQCFIERML